MVNFDNITAIVAGFSVIVGMLLAARLVIALIDAIAGRMVDWAKSRGS